MKGMLRRLARLEAERGTPPHDAAGHGLDPDTYARAHAELTRWMSMKPETWPPGAREALAPFCPGIDLGGGPA